MSRTERAVWAALASDIRFGARHFAYLLALGKPLSELWKTRVGTLRKSRLPGPVVDLFVELRTKTDPPTLLESLTAKQIEVRTLSDETYPRLLREIAVPPAVLFIRGTLDDRPAIAIVGTRKMSVYGRRVTDELVPPLVASGLTVVSGLALGIDGTAHEATLRAGGTTWAILPGGVDRPYPASHEPLARRILESGGALVSEFPPGAEALRHHFPIRNRIIAGLARATIVIEAAERSGSLLTARSALEANRDIFTVPGSIYSPGSAGPHRLIQLGAKLIHDPNDLLVELGLEQGSVEQRSRVILPDSREERLILDVLGPEPLPLDALVSQIDLDAASVMSTLTLMEMKGRVRNLGGNQYVRR